MENDPILGKLKLLGVFFLVMVIGLWQGSTDLKYLFFGKTTTAQIQEVKVQQSSGRRGRGHKHLQIIYSFTDKEDKNCLGYSNQQLDWNPPYSRDLEINYLLGENETSRYNVSRLKSDSGATGIMMFFIGLLGFIFWGKHTMKFMGDSTPQ